MHCCVVIPAETYKIASNMIINHQDVETIVLVITYHIQKQTKF